MEELDFFISYKEQNFDKTVTALINCNVIEEADILKKAKIIAADDSLEADERIKKIEELKKRLLYILENTMISGIV